MSGDIFDALEDITKKYGLPTERSEEFLDLCDAVINGDLPLDQMPDIIAEAFGVSSEVSKQVAADVVGQRLLPLANFLPGVEQEVEAFGGKLSDYPSLRIVKPERDNLAVLRELIAGLKIELTDVVIKRLLFLLEQYARGEKTEESLKTFFTRSLNIGGLGLAEDQAVALLAATLPQAASLLEEITPVATSVPVEAPKPVSPESTRPLKQELEIAPEHELAAEVPVVSHPAIPPVPPPLKRAVKAPTATPVAKKVQPAPLKKVADPDIDPSELKAPAKQAAAVRKLAQSAQDSFATALVLATENAAAVLKKNKISEKVFADLAGKAIRGLRDIYQTRDLVERDWELKGQDLATLMQAIALGVDAYQSSPQVGESKAESQKLKKVDRPAPETEELDKRFSKLTTSDTEKAIEPARAQLTVGSTALTTPEGQRKMVDVVSSSRLAGPIEQLGKMTPTEFRRLSSNAAEAGQKIEDLLSALESTSYEERVKGVLAWRDSPMNQLYLQIAAEALSQGLALPEVSSRRRAAGKESLSPAEIKALALLNTKIRF